MEDITQQNTATLFKEYYDQTLDRCGFSPVLQKGILFFLGTSIIANNTDQIIKLFPDDLRVQQELNSLIRLYGKPSEGYTPVSDIETTPLCSAILTYNHIVLHQLLKQENQFKKHLAKRTDEVSVIADANIIEEWSEDFKDSTHTLATLHRLNIKFFEYIGQYLNALHLDNFQCYAAGISFYQKYQTVDFDGTNFLNNTILDTLSPLFKTLFSYPLLYTYYPNELNSNHLFSSILQFFYLNANKDIVKHIHYYHHHIFYTNNPRKVRREWNFEKEKRGVIISQIIHNAINIRKSVVGSQRDIFINSDHYIMKEFKNATISRNDFKGAIQHLLETYYEMNFDDVINKYTHAEFLQFCAILFYETTAHAMIIEDFQTN